MKILYVVTGLTTGGAEKIVVELANQIANLGHDVCILVLKEGIEIHPNVNVEIKIIGIKSFFDFLLSFKKSQYIINTICPDIIHSHMFHANIYARLMRFLCVYPRLICSLHNNHEVSKIRNYIYKFTNFLSDLNTNVSQEAVNAYLNRRIFKKGELIPIYNGIDLDGFSINYECREMYRDKFNINQKKVFLAVGRLTIQKDYLNLLEAFKILLNSHNDIILFIIGEGEQRHNIEKYILDNHLENYIKLLGLRTDISNLMNMADFYVLSSFSEGLPTVLIEAICCEKPVISTDCGGASEILYNHDFLVEKGSPQKLAEKMNLILSYESPDLINLSKSNKQYVVNKFSNKIMSSTWLEIYGSIS